tara:strand:+ start:1366 stop:2469 length:1104 start_codon:yes stop_codon:yes gene_type:complete
VSRSINIKSLPINNDFVKKPRLNNIKLKFNRKLKILRIKSKLNPKKIQTNLTWLKENEPSSHYKKIVNIFKKKFYKDFNIIGLTYRDKNFINLLRKKIFLKTQCLDKKFYNIKDNCIGLSRIQEKISKKKYLKKIFYNKKKKIILINHALHHFINIEKFLINMSDFLTLDDIIYIEVPDCEKYIKGFDYTNIFEEHYNYFTETTLSNLLKSFGFKIINFYRYKNEYEDSLNFWIKKSNKKNNIKYNSKFEDNYINQFSKHFKKITNFFNKNKNKKFGIFGAGHHATSFINIFRLQKYNFKIYDDNNYKKGKNLPGTNFKIDGSSKIKGLDILFIGVSPDKENSIISKFKFKNMIIKSINPLSKNYFL